MSNNTMSNTIENRSMESAAEEVVNAILLASKVRQPLWLATVISTWGSSPRAPGSMMMWSPSTGVCGSVSGGCVEEDLINKFHSGTFVDDKPSRIIYGDNEGDGKQFSLPCGGKLQLLIEPLHSLEPLNSPEPLKSPELLNSREPLKSRENFSQWQKLAETLKARQGCERKVNIASGEWSLGSSNPFALSMSEKEVSIYLGPSHKLLIVGANQVASYLAQFAQALNFSVSICDPGDHTSAEFSASTENIEKGLRFLKRYPDGLIEQEFNDSASAVVAVSHDPRLDDMALLEALPGKAFYVGAMGSLRTSETRRSRLLDLGVNAEQLKKLRAPIGLDIGSKSPAEIAISIAADLVRASKLPCEN